MRIRKLNKDSSVRTRILSRGSSSDAYKAQPPFNEQLQRAHGQMVREELEKLFNEIEKQGSILAETLNVKDLKKYRDLIQRFLDSAVRQMYRVTEHHGWDLRGRHKIYSMIETVNKELENLTRMLLAKEKDRIAILAKIGQIRGILIDIYS